MKITKNYLRSIIKEELERLDEGERHGQVIFDNMSVAMFNGAEVDLENLAHYITKVGKLKQGQEVNITMDNQGIRWNGSLVAKGGDETAAKNFAHRIKSRFNSPAQSTQPAQQQTSPQQKQSQSTPGKWDPSAGYMKPV